MVSPTGWSARNHAPVGLRLILCGRYAPGLQLAKMRMGGDLAELDESDLACASIEADAYLGKLGLRVTDAERDRLSRTRPSTTPADW